MFKGPDPRAVLRLGRACAWVPPCMLAAAGGGACRRAWPRGAHLPTRPAPTPRSFKDVVPVWMVGFVPGLVTGLVGPIIAEFTPETSCVGVAGVEGVGFWAADWWVGGGGG